MKRLHVALLSILLVATAQAALHTEVAYEYLDPGHVSMLHGLDFTSLTEVVETEMPEGGGIDPNTIGPPLTENTDYVLDPAVGSIQVAPGRKPFWAKITYVWDDTPTAAEEETAGARADCDISLPILKARIQQDLADMDVEEARADQVETEMAAQVAAFDSDPALPTSPTTAQLRSAVNTLATRDKQVAVAMRDTAKGFKRSIQRFREIAKLVACENGIDLPNPTPTPTP